MLAYTVVVAIVLLTLSVRTETNKSMGHFDAHSLYSTWTDNQDAIFMHKEIHLYMTSKLWISIWSLERFAPESCRISNGHVDQATKQTLLR